MHMSIIFLSTILLSTFFYGFFFYSDLSINCFLKMLNYNNASKENRKTKTKIIKIRALYSDNIVYTK